MLNWRRLVAGLVALAVLCGLVGTVAATPAAAYTGTPPWASADPNVKGDLALFDASGGQIFSGYDITQIASYLVASTAARDGATQTSLSVATPDPAVSNPSLWCQANIQLGYQFSPAPTGLPDPGTGFDAAMPAPFLGVNLDFTAPNVESSSSNFCTDYVYSGTGTNYTSTYSHVVELRLKDAGADLLDDGKYWRAIIEFNPTQTLDVYDGLDPGSWRQLFPAPQVVTTSVTKPVATPSTDSLSHQSTVTLAVQVSASNRTHPDGTVEFFDSLDPYFYSPYSSWNYRNGQASLEFQPSDGPHQFYARFTPFSELYQVTTSAALSLRITQPAPALTRGGQAPVVQGVFEVGNALTCFAGDWNEPQNPSLAYSYAYEWRYSFGGVSSVLLTVGDSSSTSSVSPVLAPSLYGATVSCKVRVTNSDGLSTEVTPAGYAIFGGAAPEAPALASASAGPKITGSGRAATAFTCSSGLWNQTGLSFTYAWLVGGSAFNSVVTTAASAQSPTIPDSYVGRTVTCRVTAKNPDQLTASATSPGVVVQVRSKAPDLVSSANRPQILGPVRVGSTLTCTSGKWNQSGLTYSFIWRYTVKGVARFFKIRKPNTTAVTSSGQLPLAYLGAIITCRVRVTNAAGFYSQYEVNAGKVGVGASPTILPSDASNRPLIGGSHTVGARLSATTGRWLYSPPVTSGVTYRYRWLSFPAVVNGVGSGRAVLLGYGATYVVKAADRGRYIFVEVTASRRGYRDGTRTSRPFVIS